MNIKELIQRVKGRLNPREEISNEVVLDFLRTLEAARKEELTCKEIHSKLDEYVETQVASKDAARIMPLIREHLDLCPECCEEYEALLDVIEKSDKPEN